MSDPEGLQKHRIVTPDGDPVYEINVVQCVTITSLRLSLSKLTAELDRLEIRFDSATAQLIFLMRIIEQQNEEIDNLRSHLSGGQDERNRSVEWSG